jgi:hypothetical protein
VYDVSDVAIKLWRGLVIVAFFSEIGSRRRDSTNSWLNCNVVIETNLRDCNSKFVDEES